MPADQQATATILFTSHSQMPAQHSTMDWLLDYYAEQDGVHILITKQGVEPPTERFSHGGKVEHLFAFNPAEPNHAWGWNLGAKASQSPVLLFLDQTLISPAALHRAIKVCQTQAVAANLFSRTRNIEPSEQQAIIQKHKTPSFDLNPSEPAPGFCSGGFCIRKELLIALGGFDERIFDVETSLQQMSGKLNRSAGLLAGFDNSVGLRLHGESHSFKKDLTGSHDNARDKLSPQAFNFACEVHRQLMGNPDKYVQ